MPSDPPSFQGCLLFVTGTPVTIYPTETTHPQSRHSDVGLKSLKQNRACNGLVLLEQM